MACVMLILCLRDADWREDDAGRSRLTTAGRHETEPVDHSWLGTHTHHGTSAAATAAAVPIPTH